MSLYLFGCWWDMVIALDTVILCSFVRVEYLTYTMHRFGLYMILVGFCIFITSQFDLYVMYIYLIFLKFQEYK
jgi:hypothetical protein